MSVPFFFDEVDLGFEDQSSAVPWDTPFQVFMTFDRQIPWVGDICELLKSRRNRFAIAHG